MGEGNANWRRRLACLLTAMLVLVGLSGAIPAASGDPGAVQGPPTLMLIGDSLTQGSTGDYTWRYFLAKHLAKAGTAVDFVGPSQGLFDGLDRGDSMAYVDPFFDLDHAARWGNALAWPRWQWHELASYKPDVAVLFLGFNDMAVMEQTPDQVVGRLEEGMAALRAVHPTTRFVVVPPPPSGAAVIPPLNARLRTWAATLDPASVTLAAEVDDYDLGSPGTPADTWDGLHPDTRGQVKFASVVADALAQLGIGERYPRPLVFPAEGLRTPAELSSEVSGNQVRLNWVSPPGATSTHVWLRDVTGDGAWVLFARGILGNSWRSVDLVAGRRYEFRVQSVKGWVPAEDLYSNVAGVQLPAPATLPGPAPLPQSSPASSGEPSPAAIAVPALAEPPPSVSGVVVRCARASTCRAWWPQVQGATGYQVAFRTPQSPWRTARLQADTKWSRRMADDSGLWLRVRPWSANVAGPWSRIVRSRR